MIKEEKRKTLVIEPFNYKLHIVIAKDVLAARHRLDSEIGTYYGTAGVEMVACHTYNPDAFESYIILPVECEIGDVTHEVYHAVHRIMKMIGAEHENEIMAYYMGDIVQKIAEFGYYPKLTQKGAKNAKIRSVSNSKRKRMARTVVTAIDQISETSSGGSELEVERRSSGDVVQEASASSDSRDPGPYGDSIDC